MVFDPTNAENALQRPQSDTRGRVYTIHPSQEGLFYFRLLLHHSADLTSFDDLFRVNDVPCESFGYAC